MPALSALRRRVLIFPEHDLPASPGERACTRFRFLSFTVATFVLYAICNAPADRLATLVAAHPWWSGWLAPKYVTPELFMQSFVVPLKALLFGAAVVVLAVPIVSAVARALRVLDGKVVRRSAWMALLLLVICWCLAWPYHTSMWAVGNWGTFFARMSEAPFAEPHNYFHRRLLKPALAYYLQFQGPLLYWLFTMICTAVLSFLIVLYFEVMLTRGRGGEAEGRAFDRVERPPMPSAALLARADDVPDPLLRALAALGVMSTNVVMLHLAAPGYVDDLLAILILLQLVLPLTVTARLCLVALAMATHESAAAFALGPLVLVLFPTWRQRCAAWAVMAAFGVFWLASHGFDLGGWFGQHTQFEQAGTSTLEILRAYPRTALLGVFMAHKFFWLVFFAALWRLIARRDWAAAGALAACTLVPLATLPIATDASRLVGMGFAGILFSVVLLLPTLGGLGRRLFALACIASVIVPYYPSGPSWLEHPAGGYYRAIYRYFRSWLETWLFPPAMR